MADAIDNLTFADDPFAGALDDLTKQMNDEFGSATSGLQDGANQIIAELKAISDMKADAGTGQADLAAKTQDVKDDLAAFEQRFGSLGQKVGQMIRSKVSAFLPIPL
jgi:hypothetical protein